MTVVSIGIDAVSLARWDRSAVSEALGKSAARPVGASTRGPAATFAIREAVLKCLSSSILLYDPEDIAVRGPDIDLRGSAARRADQLGITRWLWSSASNADHVVAVVVALGADE